MSSRFSERTIQAWEKLNREAEEGGYRLNPDKDFTLGLVEALLTNEQRYGYQACPCRLAFGVKEKDLDIICPCDYRDDDLNEFGACYCALYVSDDWVQDRLPHKSIPERRPEKFMAEGYSAKPTAEKAMPASTGKPTLPLPVWRCKVCGYLCARETPPGKCPVCKAGKDRFERFM